MTINIFASIKQSKPPLKKHLVLVVIGGLMVLLVGNGIAHIGSVISINRLQWNTQIEMDSNVASLEIIRTVVTNKSSIMDWGEGFQYFMELFDIDHVNSTNRNHVWHDVTRNMVQDDVCEAAKSFNESGSIKRHVLFSHFNENWGAFSSRVPDRTVDWGILEDHWERKGCSRDDILAYLNNNLTLGVVTVQHQAFDHPKVHSIPLGVKTSVSGKILEKIHGLSVNRTKLLMMNHNTALLYRMNISKAITDNFQGQITNTYDPQGNIDDCYDEMLKSKFVLCPSGLGWDTYRTWEVLYMGSFPVIEHYNRSDGWHRTFSNLPVLWVERMEKVTPDLLETEYIRLTKNMKRYEFEKLKVEWWVSFITNLIQAK